jgi:anti-anti-sigma factor
MCHCYLILSALCCVAHEGKRPENQSSACASESRPQLVIDLRGVSFLDSTMLRVPIQGLGDTVARGAQLALIRPNATVWRVFVLTGLSHSFHSFGRLDEALASFGPNITTLPRG